MPNLFLFGIGGTGARVIRSLAMLAAAGVPISADRVVPVIVDTDFQNADVIRTLELLRLYGRVSAEVGRNKPGFFQPSIAAIGSLGSPDPTFRPTDSFSMEVEGTMQVPFEKFLELSDADFLVRSFFDVLFSKKNLNDSLTRGFLGNPNVGTIVLNRFRRTAEFRSFCNAFDSQDRIFLISSIFGGTGASGFPLFAKLFRSSDAALPKSQAMRSCLLGALSIMPYFNVQEDDESSIDSKSFVTKTKAALGYYYHHLDKQTDQFGTVNLIDALYYLADTPRQAYQNNEGSERQRNPAHLVELLGAVAVIEFARLPQKPPEPKAFEYSLADLEQLGLDGIGIRTKKSIGRQLTQLAMLERLYSQHVARPVAQRQPWMKHSRFDTNFLEGPFGKDLGTFLTLFREWLSELANNQRSFRPFNLDCTVEDMAHLVEGKTARNGRSSKPGRIDTEYFDRRLNQAARKGGVPGKPALFLDLLSQVTGDAITEKYPNF